MMRRKRLGELLVEEKVISLAQLNLALERMKFSKLRLGEQLIKLRICTEQNIVTALSEQLHIPVIEMSGVTFDNEVFSIVPRSVAVECNCIPFQVEGQYLHVAFADPLRIDLIQHLEAKTQRNIKKYIAGQSEIDKAIDLYYIEDDSAQAIMDNLSSMGDLQTETLSGTKSKLDDMISGLQTEVEADSVEETTGVELIRATEDRGVIATVNQIIRIAVVSNASDIHFEPQRRTLLVRQRIDGILQELTRLPKTISAAVVSRIKVIAGLDIAEKRIPQDGKIRATLDKSREVDLRISSLPTKYGEKIVIRILDQSKSSLSLEKIFVEKEEFARMRKIADSTQGMILVTGPTGSGKTTTLYSIISDLQSPNTNIVTIEDPIEYELEGVNQVQVNHQIGLNFAKILRSILRQDPEVILVGEIRDPETAQVAFQASATGHLVLSTLHTNSTYATVARLTDLEVDATVVASSLQGILAQRLVRRICADCKAEYVPETKVLKKYNLPLETKLFKGKGCETCNYTGYKGRISVIELMTMTADLRAAIASNQPEHVIKQKAIEGGMTLMYDVGKKYVLKGITSIEELERVLETVDSHAAEERSADSGLSELRAFARDSGVNPFTNSGRSNAVDSSVAEREQERVPEPPKQESPPPPETAAVCASCGESIKSKWKLCPFCGSKIEKPKPTHCPVCNEPVKPRWKLCPNCGHDLLKPAPAPEISKPKPAPEPKPKPAQGLTDTPKERPDGMMKIEGNPRVLVVDDQKAMQKLVTIALKGIDCEVSTADDGFQALDMVKRTNPHLIILDIVMPRMDGLEVCRRLRGDVRTAFIPIMMLTSLADEKSRLKGYVAGTDDYLAKPFVLEEFYTRVRNLLRRTYGYFAEEDELLSAGDEWDSATEEARVRQRILDKQSHQDRLQNSGNE